MQEIVVIDGEISLENTLDGEVELEAITDLDPEVVLSTGGAVYPHYSGSYIVTPSSSVQTLDTSDKVMDDDVTVQAVQAGSATTPATIITANPSISVSSGGLITATVSKTQQITPTVQEGYVSAGTPGNVGVSGSNTEQLSVQGAQTIHPASTDQSIASGKYLTGNQTFKAVTVSGLTADKILQGNTVEIGDSDDSDRIMKVVGTAQGGITPTGTKQISITQNGTTTEDVTNYASAEITVNVSGGGSTEPDPLNVNFYDYDGTLLYAYTASDFLVLDAMPANPTHTGLTAQGWNWTLADAKAYVTKYEYLNIGQSMVPADGKSHFFIDVPKNGLSFKLRIKTTVSGAGTINWGDGNTTTTSGTNVSAYTHSYASAGSYEITLTASSGVVKINTWSFSASEFYMRSFLREVWVGSNTEFESNDVFRYHYNLKAVAIPTSINATWGNYIFSNCGLSGVVVPSGVTTIGTYFVNLSNNCGIVAFPKSITMFGTSSDGYHFNANTKLTMLTFPEMTILGRRTLQGSCNSIKRIIIPDTVTTIRQQFAYDMQPVADVYCYPTAPPTLDNANAFSAFVSSNTTNKIYVPYSADHSILTAYQSATNWSSLASYIEEMP